jgi:hypothetical protein
MKIFFLCLSVSLFSTICFAQRIIPPKQISTELQSFFQHPSGELLTEIITSLDTDTSFMSKTDGHPPIIGFLTVALSKYENQGNFYKELSNKLKNIQDLVQYCLMLSQSKDTILNWAGHNASINDLRWGAFFASGDSRYLSKLVSEMEYCDRDDSLMLFLAGSSAKWSLCANARQYPEVKRYLENAKDTSSKSLRPHIEEALSSSPSDIKDKMIEVLKLFKRKLNPQKTDSLQALADYNSNGVQLHLALIGDKNFFEEWQKPKMPKISSQDTYKRGDNVFPIIIFASDGKDKNGNADLSYDIAIFKPDGTVYGKFEQLEIWKDAPAPVMHLVKQPINIRIENSDPLGIYKVHIRVYENIKKLNIDFDLAFRVIE